MTFTSETVRFLFHQLPTAQQVEFTEMELRLARRDQTLHIDGVMAFGEHSEVVIRIGFNMQAYAKTSDSGARR